LERRCKIREKLDLYIANLEKLMGEGLDVKWKLSISRGGIEGEKRNTSAAGTGWEENRSRLVCLASDGRKRTGTQKPTPTGIGKAKRRRQQRGSQALRKRQLKSNEKKSRVVERNDNNDKNLGADSQA
jgi:hypothetical protein